MDDPFGRAYRRGIYEELPPPAPSTRREGRDRRPPAGAEPSHAFALKGGVLTPDAAWSEGYVVVEGGRVAAVQQNAPAGVDVLDTGGVILPGLIDLHGHPEFNVFAAWEPPTLFANRYRWRDSDVYHELVRDPQNTLIESFPPVRSCATRRSVRSSAASPRSRVPAARVRAPLTRRWSATSTSSSSGSTVPGR